MFELKIVAGTAEELESKIAQLASKLNGLEKVAVADSAQLQNIKAVVNETVAPETEEDSEVTPDKQKNKYTKKQAQDKAKEVAARPYGENVGTLLSSLDIKSISAIPVDKADQVIEGLEKMVDYFEAKLKEEEAESAQQEETESNEQAEETSGDGPSIEDARALATELSQSGALSASDIKAVMHEVAKVDKLSKVPAHLAGEFIRALNERVLG